MNIKILESHGIVRNYDSVLDNFSQRLGGKYISIYDLDEMLLDGVEVDFYSENVKHMLDILKEEPTGGVKILTTKICDDKTGYPLCISFRKREGDSDWNGCLVGTRLYLYNKFIYSLGTAMLTPVMSVNKINNSDRNLQEIYDNLFYKENWNSNGNLNFLRDYFRALRKKLEKDIKDGKTNCYSLNKDEDSIIFNARLLDLFGNHIHVMSTYKNGVIGDVKMVSSTRDLSDSGFEKRMLNIEPTEFFHSLEDIFFKARIEDFDFTNPYALNHVINERRDRLPELIRNKNPIEIANSLKMAVQHGIMMSQTDCRFVVPMYNLEHAKTQFLMPIYFDFGDNMLPSNALVVDNSNGYWNIRTILNLREAYLNARLLGIPNISWLEYVTLENN